MLNFCFMVYKFLKTKILVISDVKLSKNERYYCFDAIRLQKGTCYKHSYITCIIHRPCISNYTINKVKPNVTLECRGDLVLKKSKNTCSKKKNYKYCISRVKFIRDEDEAWLNAEDLLNPKFIEEFKNEINSWFCYDKNNRHTCTSKNTRRNECAVKA